MSSKDNLNVQHLTQKLVDINIQSIDSNKENLNVESRSIKTNGNEKQKEAKTASKARLILKDNANNKQSITKAPRRPLLNVSNVINMNKQSESSNLLQRSIQSVTPSTDNQSFDYDEIAAYHPSYAQSASGHAPYYEQQALRTSVNPPPVGIGISSAHRGYSSQSLFTTTTSIETMNSSDDSESISSSVLSANKVSIEKLALDPQLFTRTAWTRYSEQMAVAHSPYIVWDAPYSVVNLPQLTAPYDLILKVWYQRQYDAKKHFKIFCVHKRFATNDKHSSDVLHSVLDERQNTVDIDIQVQDICAEAMGHVVIYMYTGHVTVTSKELIPLYTLVERLRMRGDIKKQLLINIRNQYNNNDGVIVPYLLQSQAVEAHHIKHEIFAAIEKRVINDKGDALSHLNLHRLPFILFEQFFKHSIDSCHGVLAQHVPYQIVIEYLHNYLIQQSVDTDYARAMFVSSVEMAAFDGHQCSVSQCIEFIKIMDKLYREKADSIQLYKICMKKSQFEFNPFSQSDCKALLNLIPRTFNELLVNALHLQMTMIEIALLKYKELNYEQYKNQLKAFDSKTIWNQRSQIYGEELLNVKQPTMNKTEETKNKLSVPSKPNMVNHRSSSSASHKMSSPSPTPLSGNDNTLQCVPSPPTLREWPQPPPPLRTPPSPPKTRSEVLSPMARRVAPKLTLNTSNASLLEQIPNVPHASTDDGHPSLSCTHSHSHSPSQPHPAFSDITTDILDAAIAHVQRENLQRNECDSNSSQNKDSSHSEIDAVIKSKYLKNTQRYVSPDNLIENRARNTLSLKKDPNSTNNTSSTKRVGQIREDSQNKNYSPEKLIFRSKPASPSSPAPTATYKAPKVNKGCLVETIDKYHSGVARLSPPINRRKMTDDIINTVQQHTTDDAKTFGEPSPRKRRFGYLNTSSSSPSSHHNAAPSSSSQSGAFRANNGHGVGSNGSSRTNSLSPSKRRGSGGAYCVECNQWRHKFDFTKSQWRNRPRGFRRCKFCTGEIGSDSKPAPNEWSPRRYRMKQQQQARQSQHAQYTSSNNQN